MIRIRMGKSGAEHKQTGFTMIELMFIISILGVLASLATPAYRDYTIKSKLSEITGIFTPVKTAYTIHYSVNGQMPNNLSQVKRLSNNQRDFAGNYIQWMRILNNGRVRARTKDLSELGDAADKILEFRPAVAANSTLNWTIFSRKNRDNWVPPKYLPAL